MIHSEFLETLLIQIYLMIVATYISYCKSTLGTWVSSERQVCNLSAHHMLRCARRYSRLLLSHETQQYYSEAAKLNMKTYSPSAFIKKAFVREKLSK